ncbi:restriction endonuclease subunit S [Micrococcus terreus]|uniref:restriction endonuclease subunit S n=1 Tax=Micrococcus terreus TaxID=574650 RepID=UPI0033F6EADC
MVCGCHRRVGGCLDLAGEDQEVDHRDQQQHGEEDELDRGRSLVPGSVSWIDGPAWVTDTAYWAEPSDSVSLEFLYILLQYANLPSVIAQTGVPGLNRDRAYELTVPLPPLDEQRRIVDLIGALDDAIEAAAHTESAAWKVFDHLADSLAEPCLSDTGTTLSDLVSVFDCEHKTAPQAKVGAIGHSVGTKNVRDGVIHLEGAKPIDEPTLAEWTARAVPAEGDVILTREAPPGEAGLVTADLGPVALGQRTVLLRPKDGTYGPFIWSILVSPMYRRWIDSRTMGQTVRRINVKDIQSIPVDPPPLELQILNAAGMESALETPMRCREVLSRLRNLRANLLTALLSGEHEIPQSYDELVEDAA